MSNHVAFNIVIDCDTMKDSVVTIIKSVATSLLQSNLESSNLATVAYNIAGGVATVLDVTTGVATVMMMILVLRNTKGTDYECEFLRL